MKSFRIIQIQTKIKTKTISQLIMCVDAGWNFIYTVRTFVRTFVFEYKYNWNACSLAYAYRSDANTRRAHTHTFIACLEYTSHTNRICIGSQWGFRGRLNRNIYINALYQYIMSWPTYFDTFKIGMPHSQHTLSSQIDKKNQQQIESANV